MARSKKVTQQVQEVPASESVDSLLDALWEKLRVNKPNDGSALDMHFHYLLEVIDTLLAPEPEEPEVETMWLDVTDIAALAAEFYAGNDLISIEGEPYQVLLVDEATSRVAISPKVQG